MIIDLLYIWIVVVAGQPYALAKCMTTVILNRTNITACELDLHGLVLKVGRPVHWSYV